jgi:hypothetical protein
MASKVQATKRKSGQTRIHEKNLECVSKNIVNRVKMQPIRCEKIFANHFSDKD